MKKNAKLCCGAINGLCHHKLLLFSVLYSQSQSTEGQKLLKLEKGKKSEMVLKNAGEFGDNKH